MKKRIPVILFLAAAMFASVAIAGNTSHCARKGKSLHERAIAAATLKDAQSKKPYVIVSLQLLMAHRKPVDMSFDLVATVGGKRFSKPFNFILTPAACATDCQSKCPSDIFWGDGVCSGCGCVYDKEVRLDLATLDHGEVIKIEILPARSGIKERPHRRLRKIIRI